LKQLLLSNIDGTLVDTAGAGLDALLAGMRTPFPHTATAHFRPWTCAERPMPAVIRDLFRACGVDNTPQNRDRFVGAYLQRLEAGLAAEPGPRTPRALPGVGSLLESLSADPDRFTIGLLTGNLEEGAFAKLRPFALELGFSGLVLSDWIVSTGPNWDQSLWIAPCGPLADPIPAGKP